MSATPAPWTDVAFAREICAGINRVEVTDEQDAFALGALVLGDEMPSRPVEAGNGTKCASKPSAVNWPANCSPMARTPARFSVALSIGDRGAEVGGEILAVGFSPRGDLLLRRRQRGQPPR